MSSKSVILSVKNISKCYQMYQKPAHRMLQFLFGKRKKFYQEFWALKDISFDVKRTESWGILGRNGAGKSTLLQIITGTLAPTTGSVEFKGRVAALLELGSGFNPEFTGKENVYLNASILGLSKKEIDSKYQDIVNFADIGDFVDRPVKTYPSGMMVRLAFSVIVHVDADILIVDEALAVGDAQFQFKCYNHLKKLKKKGVNLILVTHSTEQILINCQKVIVLNKGEKAFIGNAKEGVEIYKKILTNQFSLDNFELTEKANKIIVPGLSKSFNLNPKFLEYGTKKAEIIDFGIITQGEPSEKIPNKAEFEIRMIVKFKEKILFPIFAYSIKGLDGMEYTGSNTLIKDKSIEVENEGETFFIEWQQKMNIRPGFYALSFGCTAVNNSGELDVHHRLYDIIIFEVFDTQHDFVGLFSLNSEIHLEKINYN